jgi:hypothetical protein
MANTKISALTAGAPALASDLLPIDRSGANYSLMVSDVGAEILTSPKVSKSITTGINAIGNVSGSGVSIDLSLGNVITMTLTGNVTSSSFANAVASSGEEVTFIITQNGTGGYTFAWPTAVVPVGIAPAPSLAPNSVSVFKAVIDGSGNANFAANGPVTVFRLNNVAVTASQGYETIYTPTALGVYRQSMCITCIATGTTATLSGVLYFNNGNISKAIGALACTAVGLTNDANRMVYVNASSTAYNFGTAWTLTNAIGTAVYAVEYTIEYLGN